MAIIRGSDTGLQIDVFLGKMYGLDFLMMVAQNNLSEKKICYLQKIKHYICKIFQKT